MKTLTVTIDDRDWWSLAGKAERDGLKTDQLLTLLMIQAIRTQVGGKDFETNIETLWRAGKTDREMSIELNVTRVRVSEVRRRLGLTPNKGK
jgi:hypothetical protein